jgi:peptidoglycan/xylan/chitin deacetylase (PgdA/CDA1 family)
VRHWKTVAGFVAAASALGTCAAVMISGLPLPSDRTAVPKPVAATSREDPSTKDGQQPDPDVVVGSTRHKSGKHIALTFDDGPDPTWTPQVLDLLSQYRARATFCLIGTNAQAYPDLVRRIADEGHALCDHTMNHDDRLPNLPVDDRKAEIADCQDAITAAAPDATVRYFRAPEGNFSDHDDPDPDSVQRIAARLGMQPLAWSVDTQDWTRPGTDAIVSAMQQTDGDDVVLLHDAGGDRQQTLTALERILPWLVDQGYRFDLPA